MTDRELLELAAKAAGMQIQRFRLDDPMCRDVLMNGSGVRNPGQKAFPWNPLTDDGDALRLAVKLRIILKPNGPYIMAIYGRQPDAPDEPLYEMEKVEGDPYASTRRAIVRAAAEIGKEMP